MHNDVLKLTLYNLGRRSIGSPSTLYPSNNVFRFSLTMFGTSELDPQSPLEGVDFAVWRSLGMSPLSGIFFGSFTGGGGRRGFLSGRMMLASELRELLEVLVPGGTSLALTPTTAG